MRTSYPVIRGGPMLIAVALLIGAASAHAAGKAARHRFTIHGSLEAAAAHASSDSASAKLTARLSAPTHNVGLQSGGNFVVMAKLADSLQGCSGDDTIFVDGFDGNG